LHIRVGRQTSLMFLEDAINICMPSVEGRITHGRRGVANDSKRFQVLVVRVVGVRDEDVAKVVQISILKSWIGQSIVGKLLKGTYQGAIGRQNRGFHNVAQCINARGFIQKHLLSTFLQSTMIS